MASLYSGISAYTVRSVSCASSGSGVVVIVEACGIAMLPVNGGVEGGVDHHNDRHLDC